jgi:hypothetical protein
MWCFSYAQRLLILLLPWTFYIFLVWYQDSRLIFKKQCTSDHMCGPWFGGYAATTPMCSGWFPVQIFGYFTYPEKAEKRAHTTHDWSNARSAPEMESRLIDKGGKKDTCVICAHLDVDLSYHGFRSPSVGSQDVWQNPVKLLLERAQRSKGRLLSRGMGYRVPAIWTWWPWHLQPHRPWSTLSI